jgi:hypothetical protein
MDQEGSMFGAGAPLPPDIRKRMPKPGQPAPQPAPAPEPGPEPEPENPTEMDVIESMAIELIDDLGYEDMFYVEKNDAGGIDVKIAPEHQSVVTRPLESVLSTISPIMEGETLGGVEVDWRVDPGKGDEDEPFLIPLRDAEGSIQPGLKDTYEISGGVEGYEKLKWDMKNILEHMGNYMK